MSANSHGLNLVPRFCVQLFGRPWGERGLERVLFPVSSPLRAIALFGSFSLLALATLDNHFLHSNPSYPATASWRIAQGLMTPSCGKKMVLLHLRFRVIEPG